MQRNTSKIKKSHAWVSFIELNVMVNGGIAKELQRIHRHETFEHKPAVQKEEGTGRYTIKIISHTRAYLPADSFCEHLVPTLRFCSFFRMRSRREYRI
jgi:hypothetical protein